MPSLFQSDFDELSGEAGGIDVSDSKQAKSPLD
jgi:hypothetical protein